MNWAIDPAKAIDLAANKVGGISELGRQIAWDKGAIAAVKAGRNPLPPYRAAQIARIIGSDPERAYLECLKGKALTDGERALISDILKKLG